MLQNGHFDICEILSVCMYTFSFPTHFFWHKFKKRLNFQHGRRKCYIVQLNKGCTRMLWNQNDFFLFFFFFCAQHGSFKNLPHPLLSGHKTCPTPTPTHPPTQTHPLTEIPLLRLVYQCISAHFAYTNYNLVYTKLIWLIKDYP